MMSLPHAPKDKTSSKLDIKVAKAADALAAITRKEFRQQIATIPKLIVEDARVNMFLQEDIKIKNLQDYQMTMITKIEKLLRMELIAKGKDWKAFSIGGYDNGIYERFFRCQPSKYMTKPQFFTAIRRCFGDKMVQHTGAMDKLYDSFDVRRVDEMDWRSLLYLLTIALQPILPCHIHLKYGFALYASSGILDLDIQSKIDIESIKDMMCSPVLIALRGELRRQLDAAWLEIVSKYNEKNETKQSVSASSLGLSFHLYNKLLTKTSFSKYMEIGMPYGKRDPRPWTYRLEEDFFHPVIVKAIKALRRIARNDDECSKFIDRTIIRSKTITYSVWLDYVKRRMKVRRMIVIASIRWRNDMRSRCFDWWRQCTIMINSINNIQRVIRGFNARQRGYIIRRMNKRAIMLQSHARQLRVSKKYSKYVIRRGWAAVTLQRHVRGHLGRRRVKRIIEAMYDTGVRQLERERRLFIEDLQERASVMIQRRVRKWIKQRKILAKYKLKLQIEKLKTEMKVKVEEARVVTNSYRNKLTIWFAERKEEYDRETLNDMQSAADRKKIFAYRDRLAALDRLEKERVKQEKYEKAEEERIEQWLISWETKKVDRMKARAAMCRRSLLVPETPEEVALKNDLHVRIKAHMKVVLRRADKQKIPMEIPEARELAAKEIIDAETELERERCRADQLAEATAEQQRVDNKAKQELKLHLKAKKGARKWATARIQAGARAYVARKRLRKKSYDRYVKHFHPASLSYYYEDTLSRKTYWTKPKSLGSFDITPADGWCFMRDSYGDTYWYNPKLWTISYEQPYNSYICEACYKDFAVARMTTGLKKDCVCEKCFEDVTRELLKVLKPEKIYFKPFRGCVEESASTTFSMMKDISLATHILAHSPYHRSLAHEEEEDEWVDPICQRCSDLKASRVCSMCIENFCVSCYESKHSKPPWDNHIYTDIINPKLKVVAASGGKFISSKMQEKIREEEERKKKESTHALPSIKTTGSNSSGSSSSDSGNNKSVKSSKFSIFGSSSSNSVKDSSSSSGKLSKKSSKKSIGKDAVEEIDPYDIPFVEPPRQPTTTTTTTTTTATTSSSDIKNSVQRAGMLKKNASLSTKKFAALQGSDSNTPVTSDTDPFT